MCEPLESEDSEELSPSLSENTMGSESAAGVTMSSSDRTEKVDSDMVIDGDCRWC